MWTVMISVLVVLVKGLVNFRDMFDQIDIVINVWHKCYFPILLYIYIYIWCSLVF